MTFTSIAGVSGLARALGTACVDGNAGSWWCGFGSGSKDVSAARSGLVTEVGRNNILGSADLTTINKVQLTADFTTADMSGANDMTEFGIFDLTSGGKAFSVEGFRGVNFDGTQELQIEIVWRVY